MTMESVSVTPPGFFPSLSWWIPDCGHNWSTDQHCGKLHNNTSSCLHESYRKYSQNKSQGGKSYFQFLDALENSIVQSTKQFRPYNLCMC